MSTMAPVDLLQHLPHYIFLIILGRLSNIRQTAKTILNGAAEVYDDWQHFLAKCRESKARWLTADEPESLSIDRRKSRPG